MSNRPRTERVAGWGVALVVACVAVSFVPALGLTLGDDHYGRILGRMVLHADNVLDLGLRGSSWGALWQPYASGPYAHHPPGPMAIHTLVAWLQGGATSLGARLVGTVTGLGALLGVAVYARRAGGSWLAALFAVAGLAVSGFFWTFGRLGLGVVVPIAFILVREMARDRSALRWDLALGALGLTAALVSWQDAMIVGLIALADLRRSPRRALVAGVGVGIGLVLDLVWIESAAGIGALVGHLEGRAASADYTWSEWVLRQGGFFLRFESIPLFALGAVATVVGLRDERFRVPVGALLVSLLTFGFVFHQNAWVHEYWNWKSAYLLALGLGAVGAAVARRAPDWATWAVAGVVVLGCVVPLARLGGELYVTQFVETSKAGTLAERTVYPDSQPVAWTDGHIPGARWLAWYSGLRTSPISPDRDIAGDDLVLVKRWPDDGLDSVVPLDREGRYWVVERESLP